MVIGGLGIQPGIHLGKQRQRARRFFRVDQADRVADVHDDEVVDAGLWHQRDVDCLAHATEFDQRLLIGQERDDARGQG